jgi:hypothetical protein
MTGRTFCDELGIEVTLASSNYLIPFLGAKF